MSRLPFFCKIIGLNGVRMFEWIQVREFLGIRSSSSLHPLRQVSTPEAMFTHGVGPPNPPLQPQATYPRPSETTMKMHTDNPAYNHTKLWHTQGAPECECVWDAICDWKWQDLERPSLTLSHPALFPLTETDKQQSFIWKAWKNGDHLACKRQDFWTFNLPSPISTLPP